MKRIIILSFTVLTTFGIVSGQIPYFDFASQFGAKQNDYGIDLVSDSNGNVYLLGVFRDSIDLDNSSASIDMHYSNGNTDVFLINYTQDGQYLWGITIGGTGNDVATSISINQQNEVVILGNFENNMDIDPGTDTTLLTGGGLYTVQYNSSGNLIRGWNIISPLCIGKQIIYDNNSDYYYVAGQFAGTVDFDPTLTILQKTALNGQDIFMAKYSSITDSCLWVSYFSNDNIDNMRSITVDDAGNLYLSGYYYSTGFVDKLDSLGNLVWHKIFNSIFAGKTDVVSLKYNHGYLYITGNFEGEVDFDPNAGMFSMLSSGSRDIFLCKLDTTGNYTDAFHLGNNSFDTTEKMFIDSESNIYLTGTFLGSVDFDPGSNVNNLTAIGNDIFIAKYEPDLALRWAFNIVSAGTFNSGYSLCVKDTLLWVTGYFYYNNDFDPCANTQMLTTAGLNNNDAFMARYSMCGRTFIFQHDSICSGDSIFVGGNWQYADGTFADTLINGDCLEIKTTSLTINNVDTSVTQIGNMLTADNTGASYQWIDCDNGNTPVSGQTYQSFTATVSGNYAVVITQNSCSDTSLCYYINVVGIIENSSFAAVTIYPNPSNGKFIIEMGNVENGILEIYNILGEMIYSHTKTNVSMTIDLSLQYKGIYFLRFNDGVKIQTEKIVIQ